MKTTTSAHVFALVALGLLAGCDAEPMEQVTYPPGATQIATGKVAIVGGATIGFMGRTDLQGRPGAVFGTASSGSIPDNPWTTTTVLQGEALPAFGAVHRLIDVTAGTAVLTVDDASVTRDLFQRPDSLVVAQRGQLGLGGAGGSLGSVFYVELREVTRDAAGRQMAVLETWHGLPRINVSANEISTVTLAAGDRLTAPKGDYRILAVRPADPDRQLPAWVELDSQPQRP